MKNEIIYLDEEMIGSDCTFAQAQEFAKKLTVVGYPARAFDTRGVTPRGYASADNVPNGVWDAIVREVFEK